MYYLYKVSGMIVLNHKRSTWYSMFQISISRNMKCAYMAAFPKLGRN